MNRPGLTRGARRRAARAGKAFTLVELMVVIAVIAIMAGLLMPYLFQQYQRAYVGAARNQLMALAKVMQNIYRDSTYWPYENTVWSSVPNYPYPQIDARAFNSSDTVMFSTSTPAVPGGFTQLASCKSTPPGFPCWGGSGSGGSAAYLAGGSMASLTDPWGNAFMYMYIRPLDGAGGGTEAAPKGLVVLWSKGADGVDQTGCSGGGCSINYNRLAKGESSLTPACWEANAVPGQCSDDIVVLVGSTSGPPDGRGG